MKTSLATITLLLLSIRGQMWSQGTEGLNAGSDDAFSSVSPPSLYADSATLNTTATSTFQISYAPNFPDSGKPCIRTATNIWSFLIQSSVPIRLKVLWTSLSGGILAQTNYDTMKVNFPNAPAANFYYPMALAESKQGTSCLDTFDFKITFNSTKSWCYDTTGVPRSGKYDMTTSAMHEIGHGLGFETTFKVDSATGWGRWGIKYDTAAAAPLYPTIFDSAVVLGTAHPSPSRLTWEPSNSWELGQYLISNNIRFDMGDVSYQVNGNNTPKLYAPATWAKGSSICHLDSATFPVGTSNSLMKPMQSPAEVIQSPGEVGLSMLKDLGWAVNRLITFTSPKPGVAWRQGDRDTIRWSDNTGGNVTIDLLRKWPNGIFYLDSTVTSQTSSIGANQFVWRIDTHFVNGQYKLRAYLPFTGFGLSSEFTLSRLPQVAAPVFSPPEGQYPRDTLVWITTSTQGAVIRYTINAGDPDSTSAQSQPINVNTAMTIRARGFKPGCTPSTVTTARYVIGGVPPPQISPPPGAYPAPVSVNFTWQPGMYLSYAWLYNVVPPDSVFSWGSTTGTYQLNFYITGSLHVAARVWDPGTQHWSPRVDVTYDIRPGLNVCQVDSAGASFGTWSKWEGGWHPYPDTTFIRPTGSESWTLLASQDYKPSTTQKYRVWRKNGTVDSLQNHADFPVDANTSSWKAVFIPTYSDSIQAQLLEGGNPGGTIDFRDPWLVDSSDSKGNLNRGLNAIWHRNIPSPFDPSQSISYKGVFLNQDYNVPNNPYYSVGAPSSQTFSINGQQYTSSMFVRWDTVGATLQNMTAAQTGVVFKRAGATVTAKYKGHLVSLTGNATAGCSQRKIVTRGGSTHVVYESGGYIWYVRKDGNGWSNEILLSDPNYPTAKNPSIAFSGGASPAISVVWEHNAVLVPTIVDMAQSVDGGYNWQKTPIYFDYTSNINATPVIAAVGERVAVAWKAGLGCLVVKMDPMLYSGQDVNIVPGTDASSDQLSLAGANGSFKLAYRSGNSSVMYREFAPSTGYLVTFLDGTLQNLSSTQSNASKPSITCNQSGQRAFVSWEADVTGGGHHVFVSERDTNGAWRDPVEFTRGTNSLRNSCVYVNEADNQVYVTYEWVTGGDVINVASKHRPLSSPTTLWRALADVGQGQSPANPAWAGPGDSVRSVWVTGTSAPFSIATYKLTGPTSISCAVTSGWSMTGVPLEAYDFSKNAIYPTASSYAFAYVQGQGYVRKDTLSTDRGWFIKFDSTQSIVYEGDSITYKQMLANKGWNIIGSISTRIPAGNVTSYPPGIIKSPFYSFNGSYNPTDTLKPGVGYWVQTTWTGPPDTGRIILDANRFVNVDPPIDFATYDEFTIEDASGESQALYVRNGGLVHTSENLAMPPSPPDSAFDVRFESGDFLKTVFPDSGGTPLSIALNSVVYPVQVTWNVHPENGINYILVPDGGSGLGKVGESTSLSKMKNLTISSRGSGIIRLAAKPSKDAQGLPKEYALHQNFPNPFNPSTRLNYDLPHEGNVSLVVYDLLGRQVAVVVNGYQEAGYQSATWNASGQASGVYFARFTVTNVQGGLAYTKVTKLMLVR